MTPEPYLREAAIRLVAEQGVDTTLLSVTVDLRVSDAAAAYKAAGIVIQRIQGEATTDSPYYRDQLRSMAEAWSWSYPMAAKVVSDLADWIESQPRNDFTPPADAIAAAEKRGGKELSPGLAGESDDRVQGEVDLQSAMKAGAKGIRVQVSGRLGGAADTPRLHHYYHPNIAKDLHDMSEEWEDLFPHVKSLAGSILAWLEEDGTEDIDIPEAYAEAGRSRAALDFKFFLHHVLNQPITAQDKSLINSLLRSITTGEYRQTYQFRSGSDVGREVDESTSEQQGGVVS